MTALPGNPPPVLTQALQKLDRPRRSALIPHLVADTSDNYLSDWLRRAGVPVSATTIKSYRRSLKAS